MKQNTLSVGLTIIIVLFVPYLMTMIINGKKEDAGSVLESISTGRDVLICDNDVNKLIDVEQYVAAVLPGEAEPNLSREMLEAQAVAVRTKVYFAMGDKTVIDASSLSYKYYDDEAYINRWGKDNYRSIKKIYEQAVINTVGEIIKK